MREFYQVLFDAAPRNTAWTDTWAEFSAGDASFSLHAIPEAIAQTIAISDPPQPREETPIKLTLETENLEQTQARLEALGAAILVRPWQVEAREFDFMDPEGNILGVRSQSVSR